MAAGSGFSRRTWIIAGVVLLVLIGFGVGLPLALSSNGSSGSGNADDFRLRPRRAALDARQARTSAAARTGRPGGAAARNRAESRSGGLSVARAIRRRHPVPEQASRSPSTSTRASRSSSTGKQKTVPYGIGIADPQLQPGLGTPFVAAGSCFSWLHTHAADGIIHIESPVKRTFTLGNFFDIWGQPLSATQVGPEKGKVTALYNGQVWTGNPRDIPLGSHTQIQLEVGNPLVAPDPDHQLGPALGRR